MTQRVGFEPERQAEFHIESDAVPVSCCGGTAEYWNTSY